MLFSPLMAAVLAVPAAHACPTIATGTTEQLTYDVARVALVHQDRRTTFTVSVNPVGEQQNFALVLPVPALLEADDIRVIEGDVFERLDGYTGILRMADAGCASAGGGGEGEGEGEGESDAGSGSVTVEAEYLVGGYELALLSATESAGLFDWLDANGYHLAEATIPVLEDYIDEGMFFLTARVHEETAVADGSPLPPLQVAYDADVMTIPIRLAARNSPGEQDMLVYAITDRSGGAVAISNYPEFSIRDQCIWGRGGSGDFLDFYEDLFRTGWEEAGRAGWTTEWSGRPYSCSPCSPVPLFDVDLVSLGFEGDFYDHHLTRLHVRYTPETATQDLMLYSTGINRSIVTSFADANAGNETCIDSCPTRVGGSTGGGSGSDSSDASDVSDVSDSAEADGFDSGRPGSDDGEHVDEDGAGRSKGSCANTSASAAFALLLGVPALLARRRARD